MFGTGRTVMRQSELEQYPADNWPDVVYSHGRGRHSVVAQDNQGITVLDTAILLTLPQP